MNSIKLFTDSTSDLTSDITNHFNISIVPLYVTFNDDTYKDGLEIAPENLYRKVDELGVLPKTSAPSPIDFLNAFKPYVNEGKSIIYIGLSSNISSTIQNAKIAALEFPNSNIAIIDSSNLSAGIAFLVLKANDYIKAGLPFDEIVSRIESETKKIDTFFAIDTLDYLHKGGRCSSMQNFVGSILKIKPILHVVDGNIVVAQKIRGKREKTLITLFDYVSKNKDDIDFRRIIINHSFAYDDALFLKEELEKHFDFAEIVILNAGCVISSHCGPKTISLVFSRK